MSSQITDLGIISFNELWLQDLIWNLLDPVDLFQSYDCTKTSMMKLLESQWSNRQIWFLGSKECGFVYRIYQSNPNVIEPHLLGSVTRLRSIQPLATSWVFSNTQTTKINIYTPYHSVMRICQRTGYTPEGILRESFFDHGTMTDIYVLGLTKKEYMYGSQQEHTSNS